MICTKSAASPLRTIVDTLEGNPTIDYALSAKLDTFGEILQLGAGIERKTNFGSGGIIEKKDFLTAESKYLQIKQNYNGGDTIVPLGKSLYLGIGGELAVEINISEFKRRIKTIREILENE